MAWFSALRSVGKGIHNDKIFAIRRRQEDKFLLCVFNISHKKQVEGSD